MIILTREQVIDFVKEYRRFYEDFKDKFELDFNSERTRECFIKLYTTKEEFLKLTDREEKCLNYDVRDIFSFNLHLKHDNINELNKDLDQLEAMKKSIITAYETHILKSNNRLGYCNCCMEFLTYCSVIITQAIKDGRLK